MISLKLLKSIVPTKRQRQKNRVPKVLFVEMLFAVIILTYTYFSYLPGTITVTMLRCC